MPQWLYEWNLGWLHYWHEHPAQWFLAMTVLVALYVAVAMYFKRKD